MTLPDPQPSPPPPPPGPEAAPDPVPPPPPPPPAAQAAAQAANETAPPPGFAPFPVWLVPAFAPQQGTGAAPMPWPMAHATAAPPPPPPAPVADPSIAHNQRLMILAIVTAVLVIHLPWLLYLFAVQGCWGSFIDLCLAAPVGTETEDPFAEATTTAPFLFARVAFFMLRVQAVLSSDWAQMSQALQVSTGLGSFMLTKIIAAQGRIAEGSRARVLLAATCATAFVILFWAEMHLTGTSRHAELGDLTVLAYIDQELPADFLSAGAAKAGLMQYLQILRLADALLLGAALAMPKSSGKAS